MECMNRQDLPGYHREAELETGRSGTSCAALPDEVPDLEAGREAQRQAGEDSCSQGDQEQERSSLPAEQGASRKHRDRKV
eukprot:2965548-Pyramimonas_sp.AAC.1